MAIRTGKYQAVLILLGHEPPKGAIDLQEFCVSIDLQAEGVREVVFLLVMPAGLGRASEFVANARNTRTTLAFIFKT